MTQNLDHTLMDQLVADAEAEERAVAVASADADATLSELAEELLALGDRIKDLAAEKSAAQARYDELRKSVIPDTMRKLGMVTSDGRGSFTFGGGRLSLQNKVYTSCPAANREALIEYLKANGAADLVRETVNDQTLGAHVRALREEGQPLPPMVNVYDEQAVQLTRSRVPRDGWHYFDGPPA